MRDTVRIIQASDMHIGTSFSGSGLGVDKARKRRRELLGTFRRLCEVAVQREADVLVLVGDLFEAQWVSEAEVAEVRQLLAMLKRPVFITPGNHDALMPGGPYSWGEWPENVHLFGSKVQAVTLDDLGLTVHGYGYSGRWLRENPMQGYRVPEDGRLHLVLVHGSYESPEGTQYWPISRDELLGLGADYAAFGHYHQPQVLLERAGLLQAAYAGSLEPLGYDETDEHGALLLELTQGGARVEWLPLAQRAYRRIEVDVESCQTLLDVAERIRASVPEEQQGRDLLEVILIGAVDPGLWIDGVDLVERTQGVAFHLRLTDRTHVDIDSASYAPQSAAGRYVTKLRARIAAEGDEAKRHVLERALAIGIHAYERGKVVHS